MRKNKKKQKPLEVKTVYYLAMILVYLYLFGACIYKYVTSHQLSSCILEIGFILILSLVIQYTHCTVIDDNKKGKKANVRSKIYKEKKVKNRMKYYMRESIVVALAFTTLLVLMISLNEMFVDFYSIIPASLVLSVILVVFLIFTGFFILSFLTDYFLSEKLIKKGNSLVK